ncbi:hypothetical protein B0H66DRAFT_563005 [Apodospora peruviana]|uniref:Uncharacterized protein n=1 Tax=Apodospora peruviana TaxID=516989 RepID=A0AAE0HXR4_9PEZI|nr:hypothetical protein B0H66DRAFT_563005 [Apodospora peruviana]
MRALTHLTFLLSLSLGPALSLADASDPPEFDPNPQLNLRPQNITTLPYWLYGWVGSYYNGTTTFTLSPQVSAFEKGSPDLCSTFGNRTLFYTFNSLLAITKIDSNATNNGNNPVTVLLKTWPVGQTLTHPETNTNMSPTKEITDQLSWNLESATPPPESKTRLFEFSRKEETWALILGDQPAANNPSYNLTAKINFRNSLSPVPRLKVNTSTCNSHGKTTEGDVEFLTGAVHLPVLPGMSFDDPTFGVLFESQIASLQFKGQFRMKADYRGDTVDVIGTVKVDFRGVVDAARSDVLLVGREGKQPSWDRVIGFGNGTGTVDSAAPTQGAARTGLVGAVIMGVVSVAVTMLMI